MPRLSKKVIAAKLRESVKKLARQSTAVPPPAEPPRHDLEMLVEDGLSHPLEPTIEIDIKQEPLDVGDAQLPQEEMEVKVEFLDPEDLNRIEREQDPIGQEASRLLLQAQQEIRCQFCLKQFREAGGRGVISRMRIEYVLGLRKWVAPGTSPDCCEGCKKMFELFYEFKRSCLMALARPAELLVWAGNKGAAQFVDLKPKVRKKKKVVTRWPKGSKTKDLQQEMVDLDGLDVGSIQERSEVKATCTEPLSTELKRDTEEPGLKCQICNENFFEELVLKKHWSKHFQKESSETDTKQTVPEDSTNQPNLNSDSDIPTPQQNPVPDAKEVEEEEEDEEQQSKKSYCGRCRKWFVTRKIYIHHKPFCIKFHASKKSPPAFACSQCPKKYHRQQDLTVHINKHNGVRTVPCRREGCIKMFFDIKSRSKHESICGQDVKVICNVCGSVFRSTSALRSHMATHGDPKFPCELCQKSFYTKANLKKHAAAHSDERKFQCKVCGKRFKSHEANRVHQRIHTQEKPYICHICGQRFTYNCLLKAHLEKGHEPVELAPNNEVFPPNYFGGLL